MVDGLDEWVRRRRQKRVDLQIDVGAVLLAVLYGLETPAVELGFMQPASPVGKRFTGRGGRAQRTEEMRTRPGI